MGANTAVAPNLMKILYITFDGFNTPSPNNQMAETMIRDFIGGGHSVHLVQSRKSQTYPDIPSSLEGASGLSCDTIARTAVNQNNFIRRYINDLKYSLQAKRKWKKVRDADVVYVQSSPTIVLTLLLLKFFYRKPIVLSIYDVFPGHAYDIGVIASKFVYRVLKMVQKPCYRIPSAILVLSEDMKEKVIAEKARPETVHVVPAWFDVKSAREVPRNENRFIDKYNLMEDGRFCVQFAGTIGHVFNYQTVIGLAQRLQEEKGIVVQIVGNGNVKERFVAEAERLGLDNIDFYPLQPVDLVPDVYSACDVCIIPLRKGVIGNGVPSKAPILMACKRPIITSVEMNSGFAKMFAENHMGVAVDIDDLDGMANAVLDLYRDAEKRRVMAENGYSFARKNYSSDSSIEKIMNVLDEVASR